MNITVLEQEIELKEDQYLLTEDTGKVVLRNHFLNELVRILGIKEPVVTIVPEGTDPKASIYLVKAVLTIKEGVVFEEFGESNPRNLKSDISKEYPFSMARNRAVNRVILKALGLSGKVLGEDEIDKKLTKKPHEAPKSATKPVQEDKPKAQAQPQPQSQSQPKAMTKEEAGEIEMHFGTNKGKKVKDFNKYNVDFVLKLKTDNVSNKNLIAATKLYHNK